MPSIAQKLCHDIVEPTLASSSSEITRSVPSRKSFKHFKPISGNTSSRFSKPTKSIIVEKKKVISQLEPNSKTVISKLQSKERVVRKDFVNTGVNTLISGPLKCDNYCVTNVRKRENNCNCKYQKRIKTKASTKQVQTLNKICSQSDKACIHCIDTNNCATQFIENFNNNLRTQISNQLLVRKNNELKSQFYYRHTPQKFAMNTTQKWIMNAPRKSTIMNKTMDWNLTGKRWALSHYPVKGPDF